MRLKRSGWAKLEATGGLRRSNFWRGSRRFSKALAFEVVKQRIMAWVKEPSRRCSSTRAVSSCSLEIVSNAPRMSL